MISKILGLQFHTCLSPSDRRSVQQDNGNSMGTSSRSRLSDHSPPRTVEPLGSLWHCSALTLDASVRRWFIHVVPLTTKSRFSNNVVNNESNFGFLTAEADVSPACFLSQLVLIFMVKGINLMLCGSRYKDLLSREKFCVPPVWHLQSTSLTLRAMPAPFTLAAVMVPLKEGRPFSCQERGRIKGVASTSTWSLSLMTRWSPLHLSVPISSHSHRSLYSLV